MTYDAQAIGAETGQPVELYVITLGASTWRYATTESSITVQGQVYIPWPLRRTRLAQSSEKKKAKVTITVPADTPVLANYVNNAPPDPAEVTISRYHRGDATQEVLTMFRGELATASFQEGGLLAEMNCEPLLLALDAETPRYTFGGLCGNILFDRWCQVPRTHTDMVFSDKLVTAVDEENNTVTVTDASTKVDTWWTGGTLTIGNDSREILKHVGDVLTINVNFPVDVNGSLAEIEAGCAHDPFACSSAKFAHTAAGGDGNFINYGGIAYLPLINPFVSGIDTAICTG